MTNSTDKGNESAKCACGGGGGPCGGTIVMLLLVGFIFGAIIGYVAKEPINKQLTKVFSEVLKKDSDDSDKPIQRPAKSVATPEKKADETKKDPEGEKKPEEGTAPVPTPAPVPAEGS